MATEQHRLLGSRLLAAYLEDNKLSKAEFARRTDHCTTQVDRVTVSNLANEDPERARRVTVGVALAIQSASSGLIPAESWEITDDGRDIGSMVDASIGERERDSLTP